MFGKPPNLHCKVLYLGSGAPHLELMGQCRIVQATSSKPTYRRTGPSLAVVVLACPNQLTLLCFRSYLSVLSKALIIDSKRGCHIYGRIKSSAAATVRQAKSVTGGVHVEQQAGTERCRIIVVLGRAPCDTAPCKRTVTRRAAVALVAAGVKSKHATQSVTGIIGAIGVVIKILCMNLTQQGKERSCVTHVACLLLRSCPSWLHSRSSNRHACTQKHGLNGKRVRECVSVGGLMAASTSGSWEAWGSYSYPYSYAIGLLALAFSEAGTPLSTIQQPREFGILVRVSEGANGVKS